MQIIPPNIWVTGIQSIVIHAETISVLFSTLQLNTKDKDAMQLAQEEAHFL